MTSFSIAASVRPIGNPVSSAASFPTQVRRERVQLDQTAITEHKGVLDHTLQLAHITGKGESLGPPI
jgi:hypothetical protein